MNRYFDDIKIEEFTLCLDRFVIITINYKL